MDQMGSPFLLAHGLGRPVEDAETTVQIPSPGKYRVWARTRDWVAQWTEGRVDAPGKFQVLINDKPLETVFGTDGVDWHWQDGGVVQIDKKKTSLKLHDLTGLEGRCDAVLLSSDLDYIPPDAAPAAWRRELLGLPQAPVMKGNYDLVVVGGGIAGLQSALDLGDQGFKVAVVEKDASIWGKMIIVLLIQVGGLGIMILSFFTVALTGMALKFSYMGWAVVLSRMLGGFDTMGTLHRVGAVALLGSTYVFGGFALALLFRRHHPEISEGFGNRFEIVGGQLKLKDGETLDHDRLSGHFEPAFGSGSHHARSVTDHAVDVRILAATNSDLDEAITVPRQAVCAVDGASVVYRWTRRGFEPVEVELGPAALGRVVIASGLEPGDRIALRDPSAAGDDGGTGTASPPCRPPRPSPAPAGCWRRSGTDTGPAIPISSGPSRSTSGSPWRTCPTAPTSLRCSGR